MTLIRDGFDAGESWYVALDPLVLAIQKTIAGALPLTVEAIAKVVGGEWIAATNETKTDIVRLAVEWMQCSSRPTYLEVNRNRILTRRPVRSIPGEQVYSERPIDR